MATDIHIYLEHKSKKSNRFVYDFEAENSRVYILFGALAGTRGSCDPVYEPRGLPVDVSPEVMNEYDFWEADAHTPSWLTTWELRECLDLTIREYSKEYGIESVKSWLKSYEKIYEYMEYSEEEGEPSRIVFWFDN